MGVFEFLSDVMYAMNPFNQVMTMTKWIIGAVIVLVLMIMIWIYALKKESFGAPINHRFGVPIRR